MINKEKKLHQIAAKYILGENINKKITGDSNTIETYVELLEVSKQLYNALKEEKSINEISSLLDKKRSLTIEFKNLSGIDWKL